MDQYLTSFNASHHENFSFPLVAIGLPLSLLNMFATNGTKQRVISTFYGDVDYFFPTAPE